MFSDRLPPARQQGEPAAHQEPSERHRHERAEPEVRDGLVDRQVERAEVDRQPRLQLELFLGMEVAARGGRRGEGEREPGGDQEKARPHERLPTK
jgi:hypothetical protein